MIVQKEFLKKLKDFGLNSYESKLWTALLSRKISTAGELSEIAEVPRSRSYDVLQSLEKKGFIMMKLGKPIKYIAVHPSEVVERVKKSIKEDTAKTIETLDSIKSSTVLEELNLLHSQGIEKVNPFDLSGILKGRKNIHNQIESMINGAAKSVILATTEQGLLKKFEELMPAFEKAKKRGVKIKIAAPVNKNTKSAISALSKFAEIKNSSEKEKSRFCIADGKEIIFMLTDDSNTHASYDSGVWVNTKMFASTLENLFNNAWSNMQPANKLIKEF